MGKNLNINSNKLNVYKTFSQSFIITEDAVNKVRYALGNHGVFDALKYLFQNPVEGIVSLIAYPFDVCSFNGANRNNLWRIDVGSTPLRDSDDNYIKGVPLFNYQKAIEIGRFEFPKATSFLDYAPYTKIELYLPFLKIVELDPDVVMGKKIRIFYSIDFNNGMCTAYVYAYDEWIYTDTGSLVCTINGQIGAEIPFASTNKSEQARNLISQTISTATGIIGTAITNNPTFALMGVGMNTINGYMNANVDKIIKGGGTSGLMGLVAPRNAFIIWTRKNALPIDYAHSKGLPLNETYRIGDLTGFTKMENPHLDGINSATANEIEEINNLLLDGVIL